MAGGPISKRKTLLFLGDVFIVLISFNFALLIRAGQTLATVTTFRHIGLVVSLVIVYVSCFYTFDFYQLRINTFSTRFILSMVGAFGFALLFAILCFYLFPYKLGRGVFFISWALTALLVFFWRLFYSRAFNIAAPRRNVLIIGNGPTSETVVSTLERHPEYNLVGMLDRDGYEAGLLGKAGERIDSIESFIEQKSVTDVVVNFVGGDSDGLESALINLRMRGVGCYSITTFYERVLEKLPVLILDDRWFLITAGFEKLGSKLYRRFKRGVDFLVAAFLLTATMPFSLIISLLIPLTSKGPVFFVQERFGENKKRFKMIKFRTMVHDAEAKGPQWAQKRDGRVTLIGRLLRPTRLDELPQLINILKGEMSLIGPRPEREFFVRQLTEIIPYYSLRFFVKPGLTGWAQVMYKYGSDEADALEKLRYDLYYIKNQSMAMDMRIILKTVRVMLMGAGR